MKVEEENYELPSRVQSPSIKVEQHAFQVNLRGKGKIDQQLLVFTRFNFFLPTIKLEKKERKHETREEVE